MKKMGKLLAVLLCVAMLISLAAACGQSSTQNNAPSVTPSEASGDTSSAPATDSSNVSAKDSITIAITQDRGTLDPLYTVGWDNQQCLRLGSMTRTSRR
jgi:ABC-type transport system substrate-binding protein